MPLNNNHYQAPTWVNDQLPAIDADELQAISDRLQALDAGGLLYETKETTLPVSSTSANLKGLAYGQDNGIWLAGGSNVLVYSENGTDWEEVTLPSGLSEFWRTILYTNGMYVIAGNQLCAYATTGDVYDSWTQVSPAQSVTGYWSCGATLDSNFYLFSGWNAASNVFAYGDGETWTESTLPVSAMWSAAASSVTNIVVISGNFSNTALYSGPFGGSFTAATLPASLNWSSVAYGAGKYIAVAKNSSTAAVSVDLGATWSTVTLPVSALWTSITYGGGRFLAVASNNTTAITSTDGVSWSLVTMPSASNWSNVASNGSDFLAVASDSNIGVLYTAAAFSRLFHTLDVMIDAAANNALNKATDTLATTVGTRSGTQAADFTIPCNESAKAIIYFSESQNVNYGGFFIAVRESSTNFVVYPSSSSSVAIAVDDWALQWGNNTITVPGSGTALTYERFNSRGVNYSYAVFY